MTWNYRNVRYPNGTYGLHEVYYEDDGSPRGMTSDPCGFTAGSPGEMLTSLNKARDDAYMLEVFDPPEEWGDGSGQPRLPEHIHRESDIVQWGIDRNIYEGSTPQRQALKGLEEACELFVAIMMGNRDGIIDGIGDTTVCNVHQARFLGMPTAECIEHSWQEIKDRGGEMRSGVFVKEADLADAAPDEGVEPDTPMSPRDAVFALEHAMSNVFSKMLLQANMVVEQKEAT